jgi:hypothetical protein
MHTTAIASTPSALHLKTRGKYTGLERGALYRFRNARGQPEHGIG